MKQLVMDEQVICLPKIKLTQHIQEHIANC